MQTACEAGKMTSPDFSECYACPHGRTSKAISEVPCAACPHGWYASPKLSLTVLALLNEPSFCQSCPSGWFQDTAGSTNGCRECPADTYATTSGNVAKFMCVGCEMERTTRSSIPLPMLMVPSSSSLNASNEASSSSGGVAAGEGGGDGGGGGGGGGTDVDVLSGATANLFDKLPKNDNACYCRGTTTLERGLAKNQYKEAKYDQEVLKKYGSTCEVWDNVIGSPYKDFCPDDVDVCAKGGNWCLQKWCFVNDPVACAARGFDIASSDAFAAPSGDITTYYSYAVCGYPDCCEFFFFWMLLVSFTV